MQKASFPVNAKYFKEDSDQEATRVAFKWWKQIQRVMSYRARIETVTYNGENNITELVKQLDEDQIQDLPF